MQEYYLKITKFSLTEISTNSFLSNILRNLQSPKMPIPI